MTSGPGLHNPYETQARWFWRCTTICGGGTVLGILVCCLFAPMSGIWLAGIVTASILGTFALIGLITAPLMGRAARTARETLDRFRDGGALLHLRGYTLEELSVFLDTEGPRERRRNRWMIGLIFGLVGAALGAGLGMGLAKEDGWTTGPVLWVTLTPLVSLVLALVVLRAMRRSADAREASIRRGEAEAFIDPAGIWFAGRLIFHAGFYARIVEAKLVRGMPALLEVVIETRTGRGVSRSSFRVPVPSAEEARVRAILHALVA